MRREAPGYANICRIKMIKAFSVPIPMISIGNSTKFYVPQLRRWWLWRPLPGWGLGKIDTRHHLLTAGLKSCVKSSGLTSGDMSSDGPQNSNVTAMSCVLPPCCLCSSQVYQDKHSTCKLDNSTGVNLERSLRIEDFSLYGRRVRIEKNFEETEV